jgi:hypothetical protein
MLKTKNVLLAIAALSLSFGLTGCGKDNYQGTYTGTEIRAAATTGGTTTNNNYYGQNMARAVTLTLSNSGDVVSGTYQVTQSQMYGGQTGQTGYGTQESYQFTGSSSSSGQITNVMLISTGGYSQYSQCFMQGSLSSSNHGQQITGTLTSATASSSGAQTSQCGSLTLNLIRGN